MAKREDRKPLTRRKARTAALLMTFGALVCGILSVLGAITPTLYDVSVGEPSPYTIYAPRSTVDKTATLALTESARAAAQEVYAIDDARIDELVTGAESFFTQLSAVRTRAGEMLSLSQTENFSAADWSETLTAQQKDELYALTVPALDENTLTGVLTSTSQDILNLRDIVISKLRTSLEAGLSQDGVTGVRNTCVREINAMTGITASLKQTASLVFTEYMQPTLVLDEAATEKAQDAAADAVEPVSVKKGSLITSRGENVTEAQYALLDDLGLVRTGDTNVSLDVGVVLLMTGAYAVFAGYMLIYRREVFQDIRKMTLTTVLLALTMGLAFLCGKVNSALSPALIAIMLTALLVDERTSLALSALIAVSLGAMGGGEDTLYAGSFAMCASTLASGVTAVLAQKRTQSRGAIIGAGAMGGAAGCVAVAAAELIRGGTFADVAIAIAWTFGSAMISTLLVTGSLSLWENLFDVATSARLNELSNANHPLLKQLMTEAPGTYQHSVMTGALAEAAAERVGADALLARVSSYYHDVGKLRRPNYFKENQKNGENIHDTLPPQESAQIIIAHQRDGVMLLTKYKLPSAVIRICGEHHGNSLVAYFYYKAKQTDPNVKEKTFRYTGNRPSSKESAIVMMADSCEAAVRSLGDTNSEEVAKMVHKIIWSKVNADDNMMSQAPLTMAEITEIERSFLKTFSGIMHDRIEYPDMDGEKK